MGVDSVCETLPHFLTFQEDNQRQEMSRGLSMPSLAFALTLYTPK